jgi:hypothetical protein
MEKKKRDLIIAVALVSLFLLLFVKNTLGRKAPAARVAPVAEAGLSPESVQASVSSLETIRQNEKNLSAQEAYWDKEWSRDPFVPVGGETASATGASLVLSGVVWDEDSPIAMINEKVLKVGDVIEGYKIVKILPSSVVVETSSGSTIEVQLFQALPSQ